MRKSATSISITTEQLYRDILSGMVNYNKKLFDMFSFSAGMVDGYSEWEATMWASSGLLITSVGYGAWETSGSLSYAQNVQSVLITETTSYYYYNANLHRRFSRGVQWTLAFNGNHSGLSSNQRRLQQQHRLLDQLKLSLDRRNRKLHQWNRQLYSHPVGIVPLPPTPGENLANLIAYNAKSYGGGLSWTPVRRMILTGTYSRSYSNTLSNSIIFEQ